MKSYSAPAKVNTFLKITGKRDNYHEVFSRFMRVDSLYDTLEFIPKERDAFMIEGDFSCKTEQNTIYKAYIALRKATNDPALERLMKGYAIKVTKNIPAFAGLGGGSSDAATYLKMCNEVLHLGLSQESLATIGAQVGADVPFFVYGYGAANVSGIGEVVVPFEEVPLDFDIHTPKIEISTPKVYQIYREQFYKPIDGFERERLSKITSKEVLETFSIDAANDLFQPALQAYPKLKEHYQHGWFFSGSGSSFFKVNSQ